MLYISFSEFLFSFRRSSTYNITERKGYSGFKLMVIEISKKCIGFRYELLTRIMVRLFRSSLAPRKYRSEYVVGLHHST